MCVLVWRHIHTTVVLLLRPNPGTGPGLGYTGGNLSNEVLRDVFWPFPRCCCSPEARSLLLHQRSEGDAKFFISFIFLSSFAFSFQIHLHTRDRTMRSMSEKSVCVLLIFVVATDGPQRRFFATMLIGEDDDDDDDRV